MVTMATQQLSEFALHARAILGLPVPDGEIPLRSPGASAVVLSQADIDDPVLDGLAGAMASAPGIDVRIFAKPDARPGRRMAVVIAEADDVDSARERARNAAARMTVNES
jgi:phosphoribosylglycinamide formyltransferase 2